MAAGHGKDAVIKVTDAGATLRDISGFVTQGSLNQSADTAETTGLGAASKSYVAGQLDGTQSIQGIYDPTTYGYLAGIIGQIKAMEYHPQGTTATRPKATFNAIVTRISVEEGVGGAGTFQAEMQITGGVTWGTN